MRIVFFGTGAFGIPCLKALKNSRHEIPGVITTHEKPSGRHLEMKPSPLKEWALKNEMPLLHFLKFRSAETVRDLTRMAPDLFVVADFGLIFSSDHLSVPRVMALNVHPSLLPRHRGAAPVHWTLILGDKETGVTVAKVIEKLDSGDILLQRTLPISPEDDILSLENKLAHLGAEALMQALAQIESGAFALKPQTENDATYARKLMKEDGHVDWTLPASTIQDRLRAMKLWPGSFCFYKGRRLILLEASRQEAVSHGRADPRPGQILSASPDGGLWVATGRGTIELKKIQLEGRSAQSCKEFLNGFSMKEGDFLE